MKKLYNTLRNYYESVGYNIAPFGEDSFDDGFRTLILSIDEVNPIEAGFDMYEATFTITFINGNTWEENSETLWNGLCSFIPWNERVDITALSLPDNSDLMTLLDVPEFSNINVEHDADNAEEKHNVTISIKYHY